MAVEQVDPALHPTFTDQYTTDEVADGSLIIVCGDESRVVTSSELYSINYSTYSYEFAGESAITGAITALTSEDLPRVYVLSGHGETDLPTSATSTLETASYEIETLSLVASEEVPEDADAVIMYAPTSDLTDDEHDRLLSYLEDGGSFMLVTGYTFTAESMPNVADIMNAYGMQAAEGVVMEQDLGYTIAGYPYYLLPAINSTEAVGDLATENVYVLFPLAHGIETIDQYRSTLTVEALLSTSSSAYLKTDIDNAQTLEYEDGDISGQTAVGMAAYEDTDDGEQTRVVWYSTDQFLADEVNMQVGGYNSTLFVNSLTWLTGVENPTAFIASNGYGTSYLADAATSRTIDAADEVEDMGLGDPQVTIELTCSDASSISLDVGSETSDGTAYYVQLDGDGSIELVDAETVQAFFCDLTNLYEMEDAPQSYSATGLTLVSDAGTLTLSYYEDGSDASYSDSYTWYADDGSGTGQQPVDASEAEALVYDVNYLTWVACVDPSYDGSVDYGFDDPTLVATLSYVTKSTENVGDTNDDGYDDYETVETPGTFTLVVGHEQEGSLAYYARPEGSSKVYTISSSTVEELLAASIDGMLLDDVLLMDWTTVESIDATADGVTKTIELTHEETQTDEEGDGELDIETTYAVDGSETDADDVEDLLDALDGLAAEGGADGAAAGEAQVTLVFHRSTETYAEVTLAFSRYDNSFYLVTLDGTSRLLVNRNDVESIAELIGAL